MEIIKSHVTLLVAEIAQILNLIVYYPFNVVDTICSPSIAINMIRIKME